MLFQSLAAPLLLLVSGSQAGPLHNVDSLISRDMSPSYTPIDFFEKRALPPCPSRPPAGNPVTDLQREAELQDDLDAVKGPNWRPSVCGKPHWNCVYVTHGFSRGNGGITKPTVFDLGNGNIVEVYRYWQSTIQYTASGASINTYMAHGVDYVCVRGRASVLFISTGHYLNGDNITSDQSVEQCECHYPADDDKILYPYLLH